MQEVNQMSGDRWLPLFIFELSAIVAPNRFKDSRSAIADDESAMTTGRGRLLFNRIRGRAVL